MRGGGEGEQGSKTLSSAPLPPSSPAPVPPSSPPPSPVAKQRAFIADYIARHGEMAVTHPFATPCATCRHKLEASPTKDESVPHCAWAGRLRSVTFKVLTADELNAPRIPVCRQYAPARPWREIIPAHPAPPEMPRAWVQAQILHLVEAANQHGSGRNAFEFLTGRPLGGDESYSDWFKKQLAAQGGELSEAQLFSLFIWAHAEWQRARGRAFNLPLNGSAAQFGLYEERPWA